MHGFFNWPSRDCRPVSSRWASILFLLLRTCLVVQAWKGSLVAVPHSGCQPFGPLRENYSITGGLQQKNIKKLGQTRTFADCLRLLCSQRLGNYAFYTDGVCYSIYCLEKGKYICKVKRNGKINSQLMRVTRERHNLRGIRGFLKGDTDPHADLQKPQRNSSPWSNTNIFIIQPHLLRNNSQKYNNNSSTETSRDMAIRDANRDHASSYRNNSDIPLQIKFVGTDLMQANLFLGEKNQTDLSSTLTIDRHLRTNHKNTSPALQLQKRDNSREAGVKSKRNYKTHIQDFDHQKSSSSHGNTVNSSHRFSRNLLVPVFSHPVKSNLLGLKDLNVRNSTDSSVPSITELNKELAFSLQNQNSAEVRVPPLPDKFVKVDNQSTAKNDALPDHTNKSIMQQLPNGFPVQESKELKLNLHDFDDNAADAVQHNNISEITPKLTQNTSLLTADRSIVPLKQSSRDSNSQTVRAGVKESFGQDIFSSVRKSSSSGETEARMGSFELDLNNQLELHSKPLIEIRGKITSNGTILADATSESLGNFEKNLTGDDDALNIPAQNEIVGVGEGVAGSSSTLLTVTGRKSRVTTKSSIYASSPIDIPLPSRLKIPAPSENVPFLDQGCSNPMGISSGSIANSQMRASSQLSGEYAPWRGRIRMLGERGNGVWCADPNKLGNQQYLEIDLRQKSVICKVATQGDNKTPNWVKRYMIAYSMDGKHWKNYLENGRKKVFLGNKGQDDTTSKELKHPITARFVRFLPQRWRGNTICMGVELFNHTKKAPEVMTERSVIPKSYGLLDYLTFEKQDDNIILDSSPFGNNGFLNQGATIYDTHSSCRHAVRIQKGSDILLDGRNMPIKPKTAISISVWAKLDRVEGVHSLFDTIGSHSLHKQGQFHFEVIGGAVRWFHRNETAHEIFSAITEPRVIPKNVWSHYVATYDSRTGIAQIFVNGSLLASSRGHGMLSQDWDGRIGLGRHKDVRDLEGDMDEFMLFNTVLQPSKIKALSRKCYYAKYFCGATLVAESGLLVSPEYPAFHHGPVECVWDIEAEPDEVVILNIREFNPSSSLDCRTNSFEVRDAEGDTKIGNYCGVTPPSRIESHGNHMWVRYATSNGNERFKVEYHREKKRSLKKTMTMECHGSDVLENVTLVGGPKAGNFTDLGPVDSMITCIGKCCKKEDCDVSFMIDRNCYGVHCASQELCKMRKARPSRLHPMISFVSRGGKPAKVYPQIISDKDKDTSTQTDIGTAVDGDSCSHSDVHRNVTLVGGLKAGNFTSYGRVAKFTDCITSCCTQSNCDAAFMVKDTCFGVRCASDRQCAYKKARNSPYSPTLSYIIKRKTEHQEETAGTTKSIVDRRAKACGTMRVSKVYRDVTLTGGINAGDFTDRGQVANMDDCIAHCCTDDSCNLAFVIKNTCFTVKCKAYDSCGLKTAASEYYNPRIAYVNWSPPRDNLGEGILRYSYKGCWRDFDMSAFAIPLLEGTDSRLSSPYKKREDPVNDCSTVAQSHGYAVFAIQNGGACFSGPDAEQTFKRYGRSDGCKGGRGGPFANSVYRLFDDGSIMSLGCWADLQDRAFRRLEKVDSLLQDDYQKRADAVGVCAKVARKYKLRTFALQKGGQCFLGKHDSDEFIKYGPSRKCRYGLGGQMANDVYMIDGSTKLESSAAEAKSNVSANSTVVALNSTEHARNTTLEVPSGDSNVHFGDVVYKEELTDTEEIKYIFSPGEVMNNVTLASGINAGTFIDKGKLDSMADCIKACGETPQCDVAFMLGRQCFSVDCYGDSVCNTKPAFSSFYNPKVSFVKHKVVRNKKKNEGAASLVVRNDCKNYKIYENVTLVDGINSGNFSDLGHVSSMSDCISRCCSDDTCEIAFRIEDDCYGVRCYSKSTCKTRPARNSGVFHPYIAFIREIEDKKGSSQESKSKQIRPEDTLATKSNCSSDIWDGEVKVNQTLVGGINAGEFTDHGQTETIGDCMSYCCSEKTCDLAFMIDKDCYTVQCKSPGLCRTRPARPNKFHPMIAFKKPSEVVSPFILGTDVEVNGKLMSGDKSGSGEPDKLTCDASSVIRNATLKMGMHSGVFTKLGRVKDMGECIKRSCRSANADVAYVLGSMCFAVKCFSQELCKTVPVMMSLIGNLNINPSLSFLKKKQPQEISVSSSSSTDLDSIYYVLTNLAAEEDYLPFHRDLNKTAFFNKTRPGQRAFYGNITKITFGSQAKTRLIYDKVQGEDLLGRIQISNEQDATSVSDTQSQDTFSEDFGNTLPTVSQDIYSSLTSDQEAENIYEMCLDSPVTYNVTLRGGINAGNFTEQGEGLTTRECIGKCCDTPQCDLAFMFGDRCYSVACANEGMCQAVLAKPSGLEPKVAYVTKNRNLDYNSEGISYEVASDENSVCKASDLEHGPVYINKSLVGGMDAGNYTYLGKSRNMADCISRSCRADQHDMAYMIDNDCFTVHCFSADLCKLTDKQPLNGNVQISEIFKMVKKSDKKKAVLSYVVIGISGFGISLAGLFLALCYFFKRKGRIPDDSDSIENGAS